MCSTNITQEHFWNLVATTNKCPLFKYIVQTTKQFSKY